MPKLRPAILLTTLALCAWFCASGVTSLVGAASPRDAPYSTPRGVLVDEGVARSDARILEGNLFARGEEAPVVPLLPPDVTRACSGLRLVASVVDANGSVATVSGVSGKASLVRLGEVIDDAEVTAVYPTSVSMRGADGVCQLTMFAYGASEGEIDAQEYRTASLDALEERATSVLRHAERLVGEMEARGRFARTW